MLSLLYILFYVLVNEPCNLPSKKAKKIEVNMAGKHEKSKKSKKTNYPPQPTQKIYRLLQQIQLRN